MNNHLVDCFLLELICVTRALTHFIPLVINYNLATKSAVGSQSVSVKNTQRKSYTRLGRSGGATHCARLLCKAIGQDEWARLWFAELQSPPISVASNAAATDLIVQFVVQPMVQR
jgi:hypothetical protein